MKNNLQRTALTASSANHLVDGQCQIHAHPLLLTQSHAQSKIPCKGNWCTYPLLCPIQTLTETNADKQNWNNRESSQWSDLLFVIMFPFNHCTGQTWYRAYELTICMRLEHAFARHTNGFPQRVKEHSNHPSPSLGWNLCNGECAGGEGVEGWEGMGGKGTQGMCACMALHGTCTWW